MLSVHAVPFNKSAFLATTSSCSKGELGLLESACSWSAMSSLTTAPVIVRKQSGQKIAPRGLSIVMQDKQSPTFDVGSERGNEWRARPDPGGIPGMSKAGMLNHLQCKSMSGASRALLRHCSRKLSQGNVLHLR
jgi:hypothetical protein